MPPSSHDYTNDSWTRLLVERVRGVEVALEHTTLRIDERLGAISSRANQTDQRLTDGRHRMDDLDDKLRAATRELGPLMPLPEKVAEIERAVSPLPLRMTEIEDRQDAWMRNFVRLRDGLLYGIGMLLLSLLLSGKMTLDQFGKAVVAIFKALL